MLASHLLSSRSSRGVRACATAIAPLTHVEAVVEDARSRLAATSSACDERADSAADGLRVHRVSVERRSIGGREFCLYNVADWKRFAFYRVSVAQARTRTWPEHFAAEFERQLRERSTEGRQVNGEVALEVTANLGAGEANLELGELNSRVEMNIGAGKVTMDLRGEPKRDYDVQIRGGVGETVVVSSEGRRHRRKGHERHRRHQHRGSGKSGRRVGQSRPRSARR